MTKKESQKVYTKPRSQKVRVTKLQMALARDADAKNYPGAKRGAYGFHPRPGGRHQKPMSTWLA